MGLAHPLAATTTCASLATGEPIPSGAFFNLPSPNLDGVTSTCGNMGPIYATSNQPCAPLQRSATTEGLCALQGSSACLSWHRARLPVMITRVVDGRELMDEFAGGTLESYDSDYHPCGLTADAARSRLRPTND